MLTCGSPQLIAAYRVLRRQSVPWHPPCALVRLILPRCAHLPKTIEKCTQPDLCFLFQINSSDWNLQVDSHSSFLLSFPVQFSRCVSAALLPPGSCFQVSLSTYPRSVACSYFLRPTCSAFAGPQVSCLRHIVSSAFSPALRLGAHEVSPLSLFLRRFFSAFASFTSAPSLLLCFAFA